MDISELARYFLSPTVVDIFEIVSISDDPANWRMDIYLDEKKILPEELNTINSISYGFTDIVTIQDFPIRGKGVYLHIRRRKWQNIITKEIVTHQYDLTYKGTDLTEVFVAFLKATN